MSQGGVAQVDEVEPDPNVLVDEIFHPGRTKELNIPPDSGSIEILLERVGDEGSIPEVTIEERPVVRDPTTGEEFVRPFGRRSPQSGSPFLSAEKPRKFIRLDTNRRALNITIRNRIGGKGAFRARVTRIPGAGL